MKKSVIVVLLLAVLIIIVSPGIIGKLAEDSVSENLDWAAEQSGEVVISSTGFDRGWFSSEGVHRVEIGNGELRSVVSPSGNPYGNEDLPALVIATHIDHGIIPLTSINRDKGSLAPGLGRAISTLSVESPDGEAVDLPGTIYTELGLGGNLVSEYVLEAGSFDSGGEWINWEDSDLRLEVNARTGDVEYQGDLGKMDGTDVNGPWTLEGIEFDGSLSKTPFGFYVGEIGVEVKPLFATQLGMSVPVLDGASVNGQSSIEDGKLNGSFLLKFNGQAAAMPGEMSLVADMAFEGFDAAAWGVVMREMDEASSSPNPMAIISNAEDEIMDLVAAGFDINVNQFDFGTPMGEITSRLSLSMPETDRADFVWTAMLLKLTGDAYIRVPGSLVSIARSMDPQVEAFINMGILAPDGDNFAMDAKLDKGLLTINGAPIPIPLGALQ